MTYDRARVTRRAGKVAPEALNDIDRALAIRYECFSPWSWSVAVCSAHAAQGGRSVGGSRHAVRHHSLPLDRGFAERIEGRWLARARTCRSHAFAGGLRCCSQGVSEPSRQAWASAPDGRTTARAWRCPRGVFRVRRTEA